MKKAAIVMQKGGSGKSTLAVNLAVASTVKTKLFDIDPQESSSIWGEGRSAETPYVEFFTERKLAEGIKTAESDGFELIIIDTPPAAGPHAYTAAQNADLILIPCRPSKIDIDALRRTAQLVKSLNVPAFVVINAAPPSATVLLDEARILIEQEGLVTAPVVLRERSAFKAAWTQRLGVTEYERRGKAAKEIKALKQWVFEQLQLFNSSAMKRENHG